MVAAIAVAVFAGTPALADNHDDDLPMGPALTTAIESATPALLTPTTALSVRVQATAGVAPVTGVRTTMAITTDPLASLDELDGFLENPQVAQRREVAAVDLRAFDMGRPRVVGTLGAGQTASMGLLADPAALAFPRGTTGVYGVVLTTTGVDIAPVTQAFVITFSDSKLPTLNVAVVATISGSPQRAAALFSAADDPAVTLLADPTALATMEGGSPGITGREVYALPAGHLDIASAVHAGTEDLLRFAVDRSAATAPTPLAWVAVPATIDQAIVDSAHAHGALAVLAGPRTGSSAPTVPGPIAEYATTTGESIPVVIADARLSAVLGSTAASDVTSPARLVAETSLRAAAADGTQAGTVVISPGESWVVDGSRSSAAVDALFAAPWIKPVGLGSVLSLADRETVAAPESASVEGDVTPSDLVALQQLVWKISDVAMATDAPDQLLNGPATDLLAAVSLPLRSDSDVRASAIAAAHTQGELVVNAVTVTSSSELTLVSTSGNVPITVRNDLNSPVTVRVVMTSRSPSLLIDDQPLVTIPAGVEQTVLVPITGVSSDDVKVTVALRNEAGATLAVAKTLEVRVRAEWGNAATGVVTAGLVVLLIAGVWRTIRRGRRDTRMPPSVDPEVASLAPESRP
jgi:hypothetical protein